MTFTCSDSNVTIIEWRVEPHHSRYDELSYRVSLISVNDTGPLTRNCTDNTFCSQLSHFSRLDDRFANMTITLSVRAPSGSYKCHMCHICRKCEEHSEWYYLFGRLVATYINI